MPTSKQAWPNVAACWSPASPAIFSDPPSSVVSPYTSLDGRGCGIIARGTFMMPSSSSSQSRVWMLKSSVRLQFE